MRKPLFLLAFMVVSLLLMQSVRADSATIVLYTASTANPTLWEEVTINAWIKNTGTNYATFKYGLSIGNDTSGHWCNRDCYTDGLGDYATISLAPNETGVVTRRFTFDPTKYPFVEGGHYDLWQTVKNETLTDILYSHIEYSYFTIAPFYTKASAYAYAVRVVPNPLNTREVDITAWIINNGTMTYNFTLGMSIGLFDAENGAVYSYWRTSLIPPCNRECYIDGYGDFMYRLIPPNYTTYFTRKFRIADYFLEDSQYDVIIGTYTGEHGENLIYYTYFKSVGTVPRAINVSYTAPSDVFCNVTDMQVTGTAWAIPFCTPLFWAILIMFIVAGILAYATSKAGAGGNTGGVVFASVCLMFTIFYTMYGIFPTWITVLFGLAEALMLAYLLSKIFGG